MVEMRAEHAVRFGVFVFDCASGDLWKEGRRVRMQNQPRLVLRVLLSRPGELITREELRRQLWPDETFVDFDNGLNVAIRKIRDVLGDSVVAPRFIETERAVGYRFIAKVTAAGEPESNASSASAQAAPSRQPTAVHPPRSRRLVVFAATVAVVAALSIAFVATRSRTAPLTYGRSLITSVGVSQNALWIHDARGDRQLTTQGHVETEGAAALPQFSSDGKYLYYLLRHESPASPSELWRIDLASENSERMVPGFSMLQYDISPNGEEVVFWVQPVGRPSRMWRARLGGDAPPTPIGEEGDASPNFVREDEIVFRMSERNVNYLGAMNIDGSSRRKVTPLPISNVHRTSPDGQWVIVMAPFSKTPGAPPATLAMPLDGGAPREICPILCSASWSPDARLFQVKVNPPSLAGAGTMLVFPLRHRDMLPDLPAGGLTSTSGRDAVPGARIIKEKDWTITGIDDSTYAFVRASTHRNLFRVTLP